MTLSVEAPEHAMRKLRQIKPEQRLRPQEPQDRTAHRVSTDGLTSPLPAALGMSSV